MYKKISNKRSLWNILKDSYENELLVAAVIIVVIILPLICGMISKYCLSRDFAEGFVFYCVSVSITAVCFFIIYCIIRFTVCMVGINRYRKMPLTKEELISLNFASAIDFLQFINRFATYNVFGYTYILKCAEAQRLDDVVLLYRRCYELAEEDEEIIHNYVMRHIHIDDKVMYVNALLEKEKNNGK
jgi:hypothetical protein